MTTEEEYWKNRCLIAEGAADKLGSCLEQILPHVNTPGTLTYETYQRWARWKAARVTIPKSEPTTGQ